MWPPLLAVCAHHHCSAHSWSIGVFFCLACGHASLPLPVHNAHCAVRTELAGLVVCRFRHTVDCTLCVLIPCRLSLRACATSGCCDGSVPLSLLQLLASMCAVYSCSCHCRRASFLLVHNIALRPCHLPSPSHLLLLILQTTVVFSCTYNHTAWCLLFVDAAGRNSCAPTFTLGYCCPCTQALVLAAACTVSPWRWCHVLCYVRAVRVPYLF
jgi:hypothetical protein